jgi:hypothetical protein
MQIIFKKSFCIGLMYLVCQNRILDFCFFRFQNRRYKAKRKQLLSQVNTTTNTRHAPVTVLVYENHAFSGNSSSSSSSRLAHHKPPLMIPSINL